MDASSIQPGVENPVPLARVPLKVLLISLFHPELVRGGAQQICYELFEGLKELTGRQTHAVGHPQSG